jgi:hypothetical protein
LVYSDRDGYTPHDLGGVWGIGVLLPDDVRVQETDQCGRRRQEKDKEPARKIKLPDQIESNG